MSDAQASARVLRARSELILARRFYGVLIMNVEPVLSRQFPTMATNGRRHFFNPDFIATLTQKELLAVQAHESEHDARHHGTRRGGRDPMKWNIACDYAINIDLQDQGFTLPKGALIDPKYRGMSAEDIYRGRELDAAKQEQKQAQDEEQEDGQPEDNASDKGEEQSEQSAEDNDDSAENDANEPETDGESSDSQENAEADQEQNGTGEQSESDWQQQGTSSGDPGMCGEVLDSATEEKDLSDEDIRWDRLVSQAAFTAKGETPGHWTREINERNNPTRNWRDELREFCEQGALRIETWNRPNRRHSARGQILPSMQKDGIGKAALLIDTSGSMDVPSLQAVRDEAQGMLDDGVIEEIVVVYGDTEVTRIDHFATGEEIEFDPRGGGGTDLRPLFKYVADEEPDASVIICFTDLEIGNPGDEPHAPVLFAVTGYPNRVKELIAHAPWGARGLDVGAR